MNYQYLHSSVSPASQHYSIGTLTRFEYPLPLKTLADPYSLITYRRYLLASAYYNRNGLNAGTMPHVMSNQELRSAQYTHNQRHDSAFTYDEYAKMGGIVSNYIDTFQRIAKRFGI